MYVAQDRFSLTLAFEPARAPAWNAGDAPAARLLEALRAHPGRVTGLRARAVSKTKIVLSFRAAGTDGSRPPAARA